MSGKTRALYDAVLTRLKEVYSEHVGQNDTSVRGMISDFEAAILGATEAAFPSGRSRGCLLHTGRYFLN